MVMKASVQLPEPHMLANLCFQHAPLYLKLYFSFSCHVHSTIINKALILFQKTRNITACSPSFYKEKGEKQVSDAPKPSIYSAAQLFGAHFSGPQEDFLQFFISTVPLSPQGRPSTSVQTGPLSDSFPSRLANKHIENPNSFCKETSHRFFVVFSRNMRSG